MTKEFAIFDVKWMINCQLRQSDKMNTMVICYTVLKFCYEKKIIKNNPLDDDGNLRLDFTVKHSDLSDNTDEGEKKFYDFIQKWFGYTDRSHKYDNVKILEKWYPQFYGAGSVSS